MAHTTNKSAKQTKNIHIQGLTGEKIFNNVMQDMGYKVHINPDPYGYNDHLVFFDRQTPTLTQLKTLSPYHTHNCWALDADSGNFTS